MIVNCKKAGLPISEQFTLGNAYKFSPFGPIIVSKSDGAVSHSINNYSILSAFGIAFS